MFTLQVLRFTRLTAVVLAMGALAMGTSTGCTLITNVDREKIPVEQQPPFPSTGDGGTDASPPDDVDPLDGGLAEDATSTAPDADAAGDAAPSVPNDAGDAATGDGG